jgi:hypothetical protein
LIHVAFPRLNGEKSEIEMKYLHCKFHVEIPSRNSRDVYIFLYRSQFLLNLVEIRYCQTYIINDTGYAGRRETYVVIFAVRLNF